ncbi:DegT/DnrJ/EryC1/StrS family aminotransferase [Rhodococcus opacus]|uniref:DegT/DnrJ/EryC1/StrS family aminotransferase n=1 Tax=Rhodococcus opacus TaxID=37919 RepID=UPI001F564DA2|nr:DegT/DnrJ/EryC1/StrS family aminotransferase [Rhodococcus opacus]UNN05226.1 DegT/DnrJ/EryC1/StrS family aminotransferase [Rhodococcus opacus]
MSRPPSEIAFLTRALNDPDPSGRSQLVAEYESVLARTFNAPSAVALNSGSAALEASATALGARPGTSIVVSAAAPLPTLMPLIATGADLVFVDCLPDSPGMDPDDLDRQLAGRSDIPAAVEVALWGYPLPQQSKVLDVLEARGIPLIEDASHAHGARVDGRNVGTLGTVGCFSTHRMKLLSTGEGGFALTADPALAEKIRHYARIANLDGVSLGRNFKPSAFTAAIGLARLGSLHAVVDARRQRAQELLSLVPAGLSRQINFVGEPNYYNVVVLVDDLRRTERLHAALNDAGITTDPVRFRYKPGTDHPITQKWARQCANARHLATAAVQLPVDPGRNAGETADLVACAWERS